MDEEHWFDTVNKAAFRAASRREIARSLAALLPGALLGGLANTAVGKNKRGNGKKGGNGKKNGNGKKKGKGHKPHKPDRPAPPSEPDVCDANWDDAANREYCRFIRRQCDGNDPREFCITEYQSDPDLPGTIKEAACCAEGSRCCASTCCGDPEFTGPTYRCCDDDCIDTDTDRNHCGGCNNPCPDDELCVFGACVPDFEPDPDPDPCELGARAEGQDDGSCNPCPDGLTRCGPACVDTKWSEGHCGACFAPNPDGLFCCNGTLCPRGMPCSNGECTCGSFNWCYHRLLGHNVCFSGDCSLLA